MLSLVIPIYNEAGAVEDIIRRSDAALKGVEGGYEIIAVDDGSTDATPWILKKIELPSLRIVRHIKNTGNGAAIVTGIEHAKGEWIATIDADNTYRPEDIPRLYENVQIQEADMIVGFRRELTKGPFLHRNARGLLRRFAEVCSGQKIDDINSGLRICKKELIERYKELYPNWFSLHIVLMVCAGKERATILYEPISYDHRIGVSKLSPGLRGPWNFIKFFCLIPWAAVKSKRIRMLSGQNISQKQEIPTNS